MGLESLAGLRSRGGGTGWPIWCSVILEDAVRGACPGDSSVATGGGATAGRPTQRPGASHVL